MNKKSNFSPAKSNLNSLQSLQATIKAHEILLEILNDNRIMKIGRKSQNRQKLTRAEMWDAIRSKYPALSNFPIQPRYKDYYCYQGREILFKLLLEMKIHKSRHLTKAQKQKVQYELNEKVVNKL